MPKKRKYIQSTGSAKEETLTLPCEWQACQEVFSDMDEFIKHITHHISKMSTLFLTRSQHTGKACQWRECAFVVEVDSQLLVRHIYFHAFHVKLKCLGLSMVLKNNLRGCLLDSSSRNVIPDLPDRLQCAWQHCEGVYSSPHYFYSHVANHADAYPEGNNPEGGCKCLWEGCDVTVRSRYKLREHLRSHTQEKIVACPVCGGLFSNRTKFFDHIKRQSDSEAQSYQCSHCNKYFSTERLLRDHMRHHVNHYKCPFCDMTCSNPSSLRSHIKYRHCDHKPFHCEHCDFSCKAIGDLKRHTEGHGDPMYKCHVSSCGFRAKTFQSLSTHFKKTHQETDVGKYACHVCGATVSRGNVLTRHLKSLHKFKWPSGHTRFRYKLHEDGLYRLQTVRYESIELTQQILTDKASESTSQQIEEEDSDDSQDSLDSKSSQATSCVTNTADETNYYYNLDLLGEVALHPPSVAQTMQESDTSVCSDVDGQQRAPYNGNQATIAADTSGMEPQGQVIEIVPKMTEKETTQGSPMTAERLLLALQGQGQVVDGEHADLYTESSHTVQPICDSVEIQENMDTGAQYVTMAPMSLANQEAVHPDFHSNHGNSMTVDCEFQQAVKAMGIQILQ